MIAWRDPAEHGCGPELPAEVATTMMMATTMVASAAGARRERGGSEAAGYPGSRLGSCRELHRRCDPPTARVTYPIYEAVV